MRVTPALMTGVRAITLLAAALAVSACDVVVGSLNQNGKAQDEWVRSYPITPNGRVEIVNGNGQIEVTAVEGDRIEVRAIRIARGATDEQAREVLKELEIREDATAGEVRLETRVAPNSSGSRRQFEVKYHVKVPASLNVVARNTNGTVNVQGVKGEVTLDTTNGEIIGAGLAGTVEVNTVNGRVNLDVDKLAAGGLRASTTNGRVELSLPKKAAADFKLTCVNGRISVDDALGIKNESEAKRRFQGQLNGGGPRVAIDTTNGGIEVNGK